MGSLGASAATGILSEVDGASDEPKEWQYVDYRNIRGTKFDGGVFKYDVALRTLEYSVDVCCHSTINVKKSN